MHRSLSVLVVCASFALASDPPVAGKKSANVVKIKTKAEKLASDGKQVVAVTLTIEKPWHLYANPVGQEDLENQQTTVTVSGSANAEIVSVDYPKGKVIKDDVVGNYAVYEGETVIKVTIKRPADSKGDVEINVKLQACSNSKCLPPSTLTSKLESK